MNAEQPVRLLPELIAEQAARTPNALAVVDEGAARFGEAQVRAVERVLGAEAAADHAAAAADAGVEVDRDGRRAERVLDPQPPGDGAHDLVGRRLEGRLDGAEQPSHPLVVRRQLRAPVGDPRPLRVVEERVERLVERVGIDQRAAADSRSREDDEVVEHRQPPSRGRKR